MSEQLLPAPAKDLRGLDKLNEVNRLLKTLGEDLGTSSLLTHQRDAALEQLKVYGRNPQNADPIFTKEGIEILTRHAFNSPSYTTSRNALRCLANAMLLKPATRQIFVDLKYESKACNRLKHDNLDDEFLVSRILFLTTYNTNIDTEALIDQHHLSETITQNLSRHAIYQDKKKMKMKLQVDPMEDMALIETLKLLFNISHFCPQRSQAFTPAIPHILAILLKREIIPSKPLEAPFGPLINPLINLDLKHTEAIDALFPKSDPRVNSARLIELLDLAIQSYKSELDQQVSPLLTLMRKIYELAPTDVKIYMKSRILPNDEDRKQPLGRTESLSSRLLRLSTSPVAPQTREGVSSLLFEMSDKNARKFVQNVGYGFASGFLFQHNVPIPNNALDTWNTSGSDGRSNSNEKQINPVTGQAIDSELKFEGPEMTEAEKEREAEKLMVLFERLKRNGVVTAENPVAKAQREGVFEHSRFQELESDNDDDA